MSEPKLISTWEELQTCTSETHVLEIDLHFNNGWVLPKNPEIEYEEYFMNGCYLSTHTFYGSSYERSTEILQKCGFNVQLDNWDKGAEIQ